MGLAWWVWAIVAALLALIELHAPGAYFIWIAIGASVTALFDLIWGIDFVVELLVFAIASVISCAVGYWVYRKRGYYETSDTGVNQRAVTLVGARGRVSVAIRNGSGKVRLGDSDWLADGPDLEVDTPVVVKMVQGTRITVDVI